MSILEQRLQAMKEVKPETIMTTGAVAIAGGYVSIGIGVLASSAVAVKIGTASIMIGIGTVIGGAIKAGVDEYKSNQ